MASLKDFVKSNKNNPLNSQSTSQQLATQQQRNLQLAIKISHTLTGSKLGISESDTDKFGSEVVNMANSDEVLTELSNSIGNPKETESEDEFVNRAKSTLSNILKRKLMG